MIFCLQVPVTQTVMTQPSVSYAQPQYSMPSTTYSYGGAMPMYGTTGGYVSSSGSQPPAPRA